MANRPRISAYHGPKARLIGPRATHVPPAWKTSNMASTPVTQLLTNGATSTSSALPGAGKILLSNLPIDVMLDEVVDLLRKTVGQTREAIMCHDPKGRPLGIAVITFVNPSHAAAARTKYNHKVIDGRRELRIELVYDSDPPRPAPPPRAPRTLVESKKPKSLFDRIAGVSPVSTNGNSNNAVAGPSRAARQQQQQPLAFKQPARNLHVPAFVFAAHAATATSGARQRLGRLKKGPRRVRKIVTVADLDQEMDEYNAEKMVEGVS